MTDKEFISKFSKAELLDAVFYLCKSQFLGESMLLKIKCYLFEVRSRKLQEMVDENIRKAKSCGRPEEFMSNHKEWKKINLEIDRLHKNFRRNGD